MKPLGAARRPASVVRSYTLRTYYCVTPQCGLARNMGAFYFSRPVAAPFLSGIASSMSQHTKAVMNLLRDLQRAGWLAPPQPEALVAAVEKIIALFDEADQLQRCVLGRMGMGQCRHVSVPNETPFAGASHWPAALPMSIRQHMCRWSVRALGRCNTSR